MAEQVKEGTWRKHKHLSTKDCSFPLLPEADIRRLVASITNKWPPHNSPLYLKKATHHQTQVTFLHSYFRKIRTTFKQGLTTLLWQKGLQQCLEGVSVTPVGSTYLLLLMPSDLPPRNSWSAKQGDKSNISIRCSVKWQDLVWRALVPFAILP